MISKLLFRVALAVKRCGCSPKLVLWVFVAVLVVALMVPTAVRKYWEWDDHPNRGAIAIDDGAYGETYSTPEYLDQGWDAADSLWFYNTTQGSGFLPYDFFLVLEQAETREPLRSPSNMDRYRYLPQDKTALNPDALPVGFVKDTYQGRSYVGFTCAACHTGQVNLDGQAIRIDGGPAMADMVGFLRDLQKALEAARKGKKWEDFSEAVTELGNDYGTSDEVARDLKKWTDTIVLYNTVNRSTYKGKKVEYGHARLDAFGRIYNRVLQHVISPAQLEKSLAETTDATGMPVLTPDQIRAVMEGIGTTNGEPDPILRDDQFTVILERLAARLSRTNLLRVRDTVFNAPNAPVSYPFLWDIAQSDYVQWNGLASNAAPGPLGRNAGEVIGVFGILDWRVDNRLLTKLTGFSLSGLVSGQASKRKQIRFTSSVDLTNLQRLESHLRSLMSPKWPFCRDRDDRYYVPEMVDGEKYVDKRPCESGDSRFDAVKVENGRKVYVKFCQVCHEVIDRADWDRKIVANMLDIKKAGTDEAMAKNGVKYAGKSGNFKHTYQMVGGLGNVVVGDTAPVVQILTAATAGVVVTPDPDKWFFQRWYDWAYTLVMSFADNDIKKSIKHGNYRPDTTADPYNSLLAYKARPLNGIWATAPYLHNGSVPTLYDLLLPADGRPREFFVGAREFDPVRVGFRSDGPEGFKFKADRRGNRNTGHEYGVRKMNDDDRWNLIEYLKTL